MNGKYSLVSLILIALFIEGCCHPPVKQISMAKAQLMEAKEAGAPIYAPEKYKEAQSLVSKAEAEAKKSCKQSWKTVRLAQEKIVEAKEAALKKKAQAKAAARKAIDSAQAALQKAKEAEAPQYAPDLYQAACGVMKGALNSFKVGDYIRALRQANRAAQLAIKAKEAAEKVKEELSQKRRPSTHKVQKGECLWIIAGNDRIYTNPLLWPLIYWANRSQIKDPDLIYPGQVLSIPWNVPTQEQKEAISFSKHRGPWSLFDGK